MNAFSTALLVTLAVLPANAASQSPQVSATDTPVEIPITLTGIQGPTNGDFRVSSRTPLTFVNRTTEPFDVTVTVPTPLELRGLAAAASAEQWEDAVKRVSAGRGLPPLQCSRDVANRQAAASQTCVLRLRLVGGESAPLPLRGLVSSSDPDRATPISYEVQRANAPASLVANNRGLLRVTVVAAPPAETTAAFAASGEAAGTPRQSPPVTVIPDAPPSDVQTTQAQTRRLTGPPAVPAASQDAAYLPCPLPAPQAEVSIALDNTGWTTEPYLNPRNPPYLFGGEGALTGAPAIHKAYVDCLTEAIKSAGTTGLPRLEKSLEDELKNYNVELTQLTRQEWAHRYEYARTLSVRLVNRTIDRTFSITFNVPQPPELERRRFETGNDGSIDEPKFTAAKERYARTRGVQIGECRTDDTCTAVVTLAPGTVASVSASVFLSPASIVARTKAGALKSLPIELSATFFDVDLKPAYSRAYVSVVTVDNLIEPASKTSWSVNASVNGVLAPLVGAGSAFSIASPFNGERTRSYTGSGVLTLAQTLGNRADAEINLQYKTGVLGNDTTSDKITATTYRVTINSFVGSTITFGRLLVAAPSNGIAAFEQGDAIRYAYKHLAVSHILRRESGLQSPDPANRDDKSLIFDLSNVTGNDWGVLRSVNLYGSIGRDRDVMALKEKQQVDDLKKAGKNDEADALSKRERLRRTYGTIGGEIFFSSSPAATSSLAIYHSRYREQGLVLDQRPRRGKGTVALFNYGHTFFGALDPKSPLRLPTKSSLSFQFGIGTGDDEGTPNQDESYLGQTAAFAPDTFYLKQFAGKADLVSEGRALRMPTLANKRFVSGSWTVQTFSAAAWLMRQIGVPERDIAYRASIFRVNYYHFGNAVNGQHEGGLEAFTDSQVHSPKGVEMSLRFGKFWPGSALKPVLAKAPWTIVASITVKLTPP